MATTFQCNNCSNWYTTVPLKDGQECLLCAEKAHAPHQKTGVIDCHFGHKSASASEAILARIERTFEAAKNKAWEGPLLPAEEAFARAKAEMPKVADAVSWAGVFEMPGRKGDAFSARYRSFDQMNDLVQTNRRPPEDLEDVRRSMRNCDEMKQRIELLNQETLEALITLRMAAKAESGEPVLAGPKKK